MLRPKFGLFELSIKMDNQLDGIEEQPPPGKWWDVYYF